MPQRQWLELAGMGATNATIPEQHRTRRHTKHVVAAQPLEVCAAPKGLLAPQQKGMCSASTEVRLGGADAFLGHTLGNTIPNKLKIV